MVSGIKDKILHFSNPEVSVSGTATGTSSRNNARWINETALIVRNFRLTSFRPFTASVIGPGLGDACTPYTAEASVKCGPSPYTYEWYTSEDGFNYGPLEGTGETFTATLPCITGINHSYYYFKLIARSSDGQVSEAVHSIVVQGDEGPPVTMNKGLEANEIQLNNTDIVINPNPADEKVIINFYLNSLQQVLITLLDANGIVVKTLHTGMLDAGTHNKTVRMKEINTGIYIIKITGNEWVKSKKLVIVH